MLKNNIKKTRTLNEIESIKNKYKENNLTILLDTLTQKLSAQTHRLKRYIKCKNRKTHNLKFQTNEKSFYSNLRSKNIEITDEPDINEVESYWKNIWTNSETHNQNATWITEEQNDSNKYQDMPTIQITTTDFKLAVKRTHNWKTPGIDNIQNYWYKYLPATHSKFAELLHKHITENLNLPPFFTTGITYLKPKSTDTRNPSKYRPITCLPTIYKILTSIIANKINNHLTQHNIITEEQKGCRQHSRGCKEQIIIDRAITNQVIHKKRSIYCAYIDYQKAFDSVPHSWLIKVLEIYKIDTQLINFLQNTMNTWNTTIHIHTNTHNIKTNQIHIRNGIFQGDSLSALWFCIALNPLSNMLNKTTHGYKITTHNLDNNPIKINHLLYMDDLKLYAKNNNELKNLIQKTERFSIDINMKFGIDKCNTCSIQRGKPTEHIGNTLQSTNETITGLNENDYYKYLGILQNPMINDKNIKEQTTREYLKRLNTLLKTQLNGKNITKAINTYAIPVLTYTFGIVKWTNTELDDLNRKLRTTSTKHRIHHEHSATERFSLPREEGGRGFIDIKNLHHTQIINMRNYFYSKRHSAIHNEIINIDHTYTPLKLNNVEFCPEITTNNNKIDTWKNKTLHGIHPNLLRQQHIDKTLSNNWLKYSGLYAETEGFIIAIQDKIIKTKNYTKHIIKDNTITNDTCRKCKTQKETIEHITGGCPTLAQTDYTIRHDNICKHIFLEIAHKHKLINTHPKWYQYTPPAVTENDKYKLYWNRDIITDRTNLHNRPDITLIDKTQKHTYLIEISVPNSTNLHKKHMEKIDKYIPLAEQIKSQWKQDKVTIVPIIISSTGLIPKTLTQSIDTLQLPPYIITNIQKTSIINTCSIVRKFLQTPP
jgi:hypothetical protein